MARRAPEKVIDSPTPATWPKNANRAHAHILKRKVDSKPGYYLA